jgi:glycosyltransferase involved in cell wall biosynthesis/SAM-dependent methyltransferase
MHESAMYYGGRFFELYCSTINNAKLLDIGAQNVNGSLKDVCPSNLNYIGVDFVKGPGVDVVLDDPYHIPFESESIDIVVCSSCFEHSQFFWELFTELLRVLKPSGLLYLNVPSNGSFHQYPVDCWRFYPDSGHALIAWAKRKGINATLLESFVGERSTGKVKNGGGWNDFVAVFAKDYSYSDTHNNRIIDVIKNYTNGYSNKSTSDLVHNFLSPDHAALVNVEAEKTNLEIRNLKLCDEKEELKKQYEEILLANETILRSRSWRFTRPFRLIVSISHRIKSMPSALLRAINHFGSFRVVFLKSIKIIRQQGAIELLRRIHIFSNIDITKKFTIKDKYGLTWKVPKYDPNFQPRVSIIVPNYNHAQYLRQRLDSIYTQKYKNFEVILLDDCSTDSSRDILDEYANRYSNNTTTLYNIKNSGGVFNQWSRGLSMAKGELIWIAESDDWCEDNHLSELVRFFKNEAVMLAFGRSDFMDGQSNKKLWTSEDYLADLKLDIWDNPFIRSASTLVNQAWGIKNIVANVSSTVFRNKKEIAIATNDNWKNLRLCGDWIFYLNLIRGGLVGFSPKTTNKYRQHAHSTSTNTQKSDTYFKEHESVAISIYELYGVNASALKYQQESLYRHWCELHGLSRHHAFDDLYSLERARAAAQIRYPNIMMVSYALAAGGGETFPITIANEIYRNGYSVSFLNLNLGKTEPGVRAMLNPSIALFELESFESIGSICNDLDIEIIHSHHAWADMTIARVLRKYPKIRQIVTMHGMYELMPKEQICELLPMLENEVDKIVFTANKNLTPFSTDFCDRMIRIDNALETKSINPIQRETLGIGQKDFVLCLVSRAIPEKGWQEAISAVNLAQSMSERKLQLLLIGEGEEFTRLRSLNANESIHFLGFKANIRDYFAMADLGFLPSKFKGESFPLVVIDCLLAGTPVLASAIGEIPIMLRTENGMAGELFELEEFEIPVKKLAIKIANLSSNFDFYERILSQVPSAASRFNVATMIKKYTDLYNVMLYGH